MKKVMLGLLVTLVFQFCTSELSEIDGMIGSHVDYLGGNGAGLEIPNNQFLGQYFGIDEGNSLLFSRFERRIRHDFNSPVREEILSKELGAKWTGYFEFVAGTYTFDVNSDKRILLAIDGEVILNKHGKTKNEKAVKDLKGIHLVEVEYNLEDNVSNNDGSPDESSSTEGTTGASSSIEGNTDTSSSTGGTTDISSSTGSTTDTGSSTGGTTDTGSSTGGTTDTSSSTGSTTDTGSSTGGTTDTSSSTGDIINGDVVDTSSDSPTVEVVWEAETQLPSGISFTAQEVAIWKERMLDPKFENEWSRILNSANAALNGNLNRYDNYYKGGLWPDFTEYGSEVYKYEPRPESKSSMSILHSAFVYLLVEDDKYKNVVEQELLRYSRIPELDYADQNIFPLFQSVNPGFFIAEWMTKLLTAKDYTKINNSDVDDWFHSFADYAKRNLKRCYSGHIPNRLSDDYQVINSGWSDTKLGKMWDGGPYGFGFHDLFNNRTIAYVRFLMLHGYLYNRMDEVELCKRHFKEYIAFGTYKDDCTWMEMYRARTTDPEAGTRYGGIAVYSLSYLADLAARQGDRSLYNYVVTQEEYDKFYKANLDREFIKLVAATGKSLEKAIDTYLKIYDGTFNRYVYGEKIDGITSTGWYQKYTIDNLFVQSNLYYKNSNWKSIYLRQKEGTAKLENIGQVGSWKQDNGLMGTLPGHQYLWAGLEGQLWPYK